MVTEVKHVTPQGLDIIKSFEGFSDKVYVCPAGYKTIGYGHLVKKGEDFSKGVSPFEAERLLYMDIQFAENAVKRLIHVYLNKWQFESLVSFTYNLGSGALQRSTLRRKVNREEHDDVPLELLKWVWAGGKRMPGLIKRRVIEGQHYST